MIRSHGLCQACRSKELTPKKKDRITSIKNSSKKKKLEVGKQRAADTRQAALRIQHIGLGCHTDEGSQGIKHIYEQEREHDYQEIQ